MMGIMEESTIPGRSKDGLLSPRCPGGAAWEQPQHPQLTYGKAQPGVGADQAVNVGGQRDLAEEREEV